MGGPSLPPASEPLTADVVLARWPTSPTKRELIHGVLYFTGSFDERDIDIAERTYPGRRALINAEGALEIHPGGPGQAQSILDDVDGRHRETDRDPYRGAVLE